MVYSKVRPLFYISASFLLETIQDCNIVTISQNLIVEVNCTVYLVTIRLPEKERYKAAIANLSVCGVGNDIIIERSKAV